MKTFESALTTLPKPARPQLIFLCECSPLHLRQALQAGELRDLLSREHFAIAFGLRQYDDEHAALIRWLNQAEIPVIAWLLLPPSAGSWLSLRNYPRAIEQYRAFQRWAKQEQLRFVAVGLDMEPPSELVGGRRTHLVTNLLWRVFHARGNSLYPAARTAYAELVTEIHFDGYEVHSYQIPLIADDRRSGTSLIQRSLDVVEIAADVEALMCYSSFPSPRLANDLGGALIANYGPDADALAVGSVGLATDEDGLPPLTWEALERDLLLASRHTDLIYLHSLEGCLERGLLPKIATLDWDREPELDGLRQTLIGSLRGLLRFQLLSSRLGGRMFAWLGWLVAAILLVREWQRRTNEERSDRGQKTC